MQYVVVLFALWATMAHAQHTWRPKFVIVDGTPRSTCACRMSTDGKSLMCSIQEIARLEHMRGFDSPVPAEIDFGAYDDPKHRVVWATSNQARKKLMPLLTKKNIESCLALTDASEGLKDIIRSYNIKSRFVIEPGG